MEDNSVPRGAEMSQLRQEAIRRAREMQARAQIPPVYPDEPPEPEPEPAEPPPPPEQPGPPPPPEHGGNAGPHPHVGQMPVPMRQSGGQARRPEPGPPSVQKLGGTLDFLTKDPERAMILMLMLILMEEKADNSLLFAMMYLLS